MQQNEASAINRLYSEVHGLRTDFKHFVNTAETDIRGLMVHSERIAAKVENASADVVEMRRRLLGDDGRSGEMALVSERLAELEREAWRKKGAGLVLHTLATAAGVLAAIIAAYAGLKQAGLMVTW